MDLRLQKRWTASIRVRQDRWKWLKRQCSTLLTYEHLPLEDKTRQLRLYNVPAGTVRNLMTVLHRQKEPFDCHWASGVTDYARVTGDAEYRTYYGHEAEVEGPMYSWENQDAYFKRMLTRSLLKGETHG